MDFEREVESLGRSVEDITARQHKLAERLAEARAFTARFLQACSDNGITVAGVGKKHPKLGNEKWPFSPGRSVFCEKDARTNDGWPAIWSVVNQLGIGDGAGNTGQHQADTSKLIDGVYECRDGQWLRIDTATPEAISY